MKQRFRRMGEVVLFCALLIVAICFFMPTATASSSQGIDVASGQILFSYQTALSIWQPVALFVVVLGLCQWVAGRFCAIVHRRPWLFLQLFSLLALGKLGFLLYSLFVVAAWPPVIVAGLLQGGLGVLGSVVVVRKG